MATLSTEELYHEGMRYMNGDGVKKSITKASDCFEQAIAIGSPEAKRELGLILLGDGLLHTDASNLSGLSEEIARHKRGELLLEEAASEGDISAKRWFIKKNDVSLFAFFLGCFPKISVYVEQKKKCKLARQYKNELISLGDAETLYEKAFASLVPDKGIIEKLAEQGYAPAEYTLGMWYLKGMNFEKDLEKAKYWLSISSKHGNAEAKKLLASL